MVVNEVDVVAPPHPLPKLPVARAVWACRPDFKTACAAWIYAGGAHHTAFSQALTTEHLRDFAAIANVEIAAIDGKTELLSFRESLRNAEIYFHLALGLGQM
jgi:L-arabinose isomerase